MRGWLVAYNAGSTPCTATVPTMHGVHRQRPEPLVLVTIVCVWGGDVLDPVDEGVFLVCVN